MKIPSIQQLKGMEIVDALDLLDNVKEKMKNRIKSANGDKRYLEYRLYEIMLLEDEFLKCSEDDY
jgi:hypothetical protein